MLRWSPFSGVALDFCCVLLFLHPYSGQMQTRCWPTVSTFDERSLCIARCSLLHLSLCRTPSSTTHTGAPGAALYDGVYNDKDIQVLKKAFCATTSSDILKIMREKGFTTAVIGGLVSYPLATGNRLHTAFQLLNDYTPHNVF